MTHLETLLEDFGLSETEIAVYRSVLQGGEATAGDVAEEAGVTQSYVYSVAETLADRDLITIDDTVAPTRLRARPPEEVTAMLSDRVSALETEMQSLYTSPSRSPDGFSVLGSRQTVRGHVEELIERAASELLLVLPQHVATELGTAIEAARERGVFVLLLLTETDAESVVEGAWPATMTRAWGASPPIFAVADGQSGVMGEPGMLSGRHGDEQTLAVADRTIADGFVGMALSNYWPMGDVVDAAPPRPLPASYSCFRAGVFDAARRIADGEQLVGTVTVRTETGETRTLEDVPVVEVKQGLVEPTTNEFPNENSIVFDADDGPVTVGCPGGIGAFYEDYAGTSLTLTAADESP